MTRKKDEDAVENRIQTRLDVLAAYTPREHIRAAEKWIDAAERTVFAPAQGAASAMATAHATLAVAKATLHRSWP